MTSAVSFMVSIQDDLRAVETLMRSQADERYPDLQSALDLLLSAGGKRIRPTLTLLAGKMLRAKGEPLLHLAAAIEMLHTATLVHDDLIDGSLLRRGMPTLNSRWSPGATVLTGDYLFARAANLAAQTDSIPVMKLFSETLSIIVGGELPQMFSTRCKADRTNYYQRIYAKTASLFETSAKSAALLCLTSELHTEALRAYGYSVGMAFQIIDDILDYTGEQATLGKPIGSDLRQGLVTLPAIYFAEMHPEHPLTINLIEGNCIQDQDVLDELIGAIRSSKAIQQSHQEAIQFVETALNHLSIFDPCPERLALEELAHHVVDRKF
ncbi:polyprenyl synthetase family protein [Anaerolinea sp.]|uniref:polyprenyl synthetase family protein n=1 Tax=Anaerolinea sp. TaxID=1872519 RepID=UPI002ACD20F7|nr:polyprenyl synthetase family protein [Anaerolinea sp.]